MQLMEFVLVLVSNDTDSGIVPKQMRWPGKGFHWVMTCYQTQMSHEITLAI